MSKAELHAKILDLVRDYHAEAFPAREFVAGVTPVQYAGRVFDAEEIVNLVDSSLEFWLTTGRYAAQFEKDFARFFGLRNSLLVNSGSSANLVAVSCLTSPKLGDRQLKPGDEVITAATGFPTTIRLFRIGWCRCFSTLKFRPITFDRISWMPHSRRGPRRSWRRTLWGIHLILA